MYFFDKLDCGIIYGGKRCGKSNLLTYMIFHADNLGWRSYSNMTIKGLNRFVKLDSSTPERFLSQLEIIIKVKFESRDFSNVFVGIDEFPNIIHAQNWKDGTKWSKTFDQLGKVGITCFATATNFNKVYNGFRETCNKRINCKMYGDTYYLASYERQNDQDYEQYDMFLKQLVDSRPMRAYYDTHEVMYL